MLFYFVHCNAGGCFKFLILVSVINNNILYFDIEMVDGGRQKEGHKQKTNLFIE